MAGGSLTLWWLGGRGAYIYAAGVAYTRNVIADDSIDVVKKEENYIFFCQVCGCVQSPIKWAALIGRIDGRLWMEN
jgi:hypothetical protein